MATAKNLILQVVEGLPYDLLEDFNHFVKASNDVKSLARLRDPSVIRAAVRLEKHRKLLVDAIKKKRKDGVLDDDTVKKAVDLIYRIYNETLDVAEKELKFYLKHTSKK